MNSKIFILVLLLITLGIVGFYLYGNQSKTKNAPLYNTLKNTTNQTNTISVPVSPNAIGVKSLLLFYIFSGKITNIEPLKEGYKLTLDTSSQDTPQFIINSETMVFKNTKQLSQANLGSIKIGEQASLSMTYNPKTKSWNLNSVTLSE